MKREERDEAPAPKAAPPTKRIKTKKEFPVVICVFRGESSKDPSGRKRGWCSSGLRQAPTPLQIEDKRFAEVEQSGKILVPACWDCADCALKLRPGVPLNILCEWYVAGPACIQDPGFKAEFDGAIKVWHALSMAEATKPRFSPEASVLSRQVYGMRIVQEFGLLTENEYIQVIGNSPSVLPKNKALRPVSLPFFSPNSNTNFYVIDLLGADPQVLSGMRRAEIYYDTSSELAEAVLQGAQQLSENQGHKVFDYLAAGMTERRPAPLKGSAKARPKNIQQLLSEHDLQEAQVEVPAVEVVENDEEEEDTGAAAAAGSSTDGPSRIAGFNLPQQARTACKKRAKPATPSAPSSAAATTSSSPVPVPAPKARPETQRDPAGGDGRSESTVKNCRNSKADKEGVYQKLDPGMKRVADKYLELIPNASVRSLEHLVPQSFLLNPSKQTSNSLTGAKRILDGLQKGKSLTAAEALEERLLQCEHAAALEGGMLVMQCKFSDLRGHLFRTQDLWHSFPFLLQVRVSLRFGVESMKDCCEHYWKLFVGKQDKKKTKVETTEGDGDGPDKCSASAANKGSKDSASAATWKGQVEACLGLLRFDKELNHRMFQFQFDGNKPQLHDTIGLMMHALSESTMDLEAELELDLAEDVKDGQGDEDDTKQDGGKKMTALQGVRAAVEAGLVALELLLLDLADAKDFYFSKIPRMPSFQF
ncbi:unnamed protein product [Symbiodinium sp. CCMP2592]|nr:unnamed protein product [Symbiodinium sp. CCMP2592]